MWRRSRLRQRNARMLCCVALAIAAGTVAVWRLPAQQPEATKPAESTTEKTPLPGAAIARLGTPRAVLIGYTTALATSPDTRLLAVATQNRSNGRTQLALLDAKTGELKRKFAEGQTTHPLLGFDGDGKTLHASDQSWSIESGEKIARPFDGNLVAISPNGKFWAFLRPHDGQVVVWDVGKKAELAALGSRSIPGTLNAAAVTDDGKYLAHSANNQLHIVETANAKSLDPVVLAQNSAMVRVLAVPGTNRFFAFGYGNRAALVDAAAGKMVQEFQDEANSYFSQAVASADGKRIACATSRRIVRLWDVATGDVVKDLPIDDYQVYALAYSGDGKTLYASAERPGRDTRIFAWNTSNWEDTSRENSLQGPVRRLLFSPDGKWLAADSVHGTIMLWNVAEQRLDKTLAADASFDLRFSPDGWLLGAAGANNWYAIWEVESGDQVFTGRADPSQYNSAASFSPELDRLAVNRSNSELRVVKITNGEAVYESRNQGGEYRGPVNSLAHSPDGKTLVHTNDYYSGNAGPPPLTLVEIAGGKTTRPFKPDPTPLNPNDGYRRGSRLFRAQWSPDGATVAATDERGEISMWDVRTGDFLHGLGRCEIHPAFSIDGHYVAGFGNHMVLIHEVHSGDEVFNRTIGETTDPNRGSSYVQPNSLPEQGLTAVALSPDGRWLAGAYRNDDTILFWNLVPFEDQEVSRLPQAAASDHEQWWAALAGNSPKAAYAAVWRFALAGDAAVVFLKQHIGQAAATGNDRARIGQLIADLDADQLATRKAAAQSLRALGPSALPALEEALKNNPSAEVKRAISAIKQPGAARGDQVSGDQLRRLRALAALEHNGSPPAAEVVATLAGGSDDERETWFAKATLARMKARSASK